MAVHLDGARYGQKSSAISSTVICTVMRVMLSALIILKADVVRQYNMPIFGAVKPGERMSRFCQLIGIALVIALAGSLAKADDAEEGRAFAEKACQRCHNIDPDGALQQTPPSFADISTSRSPEQIRERIMAPPPESAMPMVGLIWADGKHVHDVVAYPGYVDDLVAYILSLARP